MAENSWPYVDQATTDLQYTLLSREYTLPGVVGSFNDSALTVVGTSEGMTTTVRPGRAVIRGYMYQNTSNVTVPHEAANSSPRIDRVVLRLDLTKPVGNRISVAVIKGTPAGTPSAPGLTETETGVYEVPLALVTIRSGTTGINASDVTDDRAFGGMSTGSWRTSNRPKNPRHGQFGANITTALFEFWTGSSWSSVFAPGQIPNLDASKITSGILGVDRIPAHSADKVTSGAFHVDRIPAIPATKVTSGTFTSDRIPSLDASKITAGVLNLARIPVLDASRIPNLAASKITAGAFHIDRIPGLPASRITSGYISSDRLYNVSGGADWARLFEGNMQGRPDGKYLSFRITTGNNIGIYYGDVGIFNMIGLTQTGGAMGSGYERVTGAYATIQAEGIYRHTSSGSANVYVSGEGTLRRSTSSRRYKTDEQPARDMSAILDVVPKTWKPKDPTTLEVDDDTRYFGLIAEDLHDLGLHELVVYDDEGRPDAISEARVAYTLIPIIKSLQERVEALENAR